MSGRRRSGGKLFQIRGRQRGETPVTKTSTGPRDDACVHVGRTQTAAKLVRLRESQDTIVSKVGRRQAMQMCVSTGQRRPRAKRAGPQRPQFFSGTPIGLRKGEQNWGFT